MPAGKRESTALESHALGVVRFRDLCVAMIPTNARTCFPQSGSGVPPLVRRFRFPCPNFRVPRSAFGIGSRPASPHPHSRCRWGEAPAEPSPFLSSLPSSEFVRGSRRAVPVCFGPMVRGPAVISPALPFALAKSGLRLQYRDPNEKHATGNNER
jgi:hypothetical protein